MVRFLCVFFVCFFLHISAGGRDEGSVEDLGEEVGGDYGLVDQRARSHYSIEDSGSEDSISYGDEKSHSSKKRRKQTTVQPVSRRGKGQKTKGGRKKETDGDDDAKTAKVVVANSPFKLMLNIVAGEEKKFLVDDMKHVLTNYASESNIIVNSYVTGLPKYFNENPRLRASFMLITVAAPELLNFECFSNVLAIDRLGMVLVHHVKGRDAIISAIEKVL